MRVGADDRVGIRNHFAALGCFGGENHAGQVLEIDLVADAHARGHGRKIVERSLSPLEEGVALAVALELKRGVHVVGVRGAKLVHLHGVVDDQLRRLQRVDLVRVASQRLHGVSHRGQVDDCGHAGEVLHQHARGHVGDLARGLGFGVPVGEKADVVRRHGAAIFVAQQILKQDAQGERKLRQVSRRVGPGNCVQVEIGDSLRSALQGRFCSERVRMDRHGAHKEILQGSVPAA